MQIILKMLTTTLAKKILIGLAETLAKRTDNTLDDDIVQVIKTALGEK